MRVYTLSTFGDTMTLVEIRFKCSGDSFVWVESKAQKNLTKHGVRFEEAAPVFSDPNFVLVDASRNDEARDAVIGFDNTGRLLFVVHIEFEDTYIRRVSARRAEPNEEQKYAF